MSLQTNNNLSLVHCRQMAKGEFDHIASKDPCTIYFVNETGVFTGQSLDEEGDIYLGEKLLTAKPDLTGLVQVDGAAHTLNNYTGSEFVEVFELSAGLDNADILDFFTHLTIKHTSANVVDVECWLETGHYVEQDGQMKYVCDCIVAGAQTSMPASRNSAPVFGNLNFAGTVEGPIPSKLVKLTFNASSTITVMSHTQTSNIDKASQVLIRTYQSKKS